MSSEKKEIKLPKFNKSMEEYAARLASDDAAMKELTKPTTRSNPFYNIDSESNETHIEPESIEPKKKNEDTPPEEDNTEDWILNESNNGGIIKQLDHTVTFSFDGWINPKTGKPYNRYHYMENPVMMKFVSHESGDNEGYQDSYVNMVITKNMAQSLSKYFDNIYRSYMGMEIKDKEEPLKERLKPANIMASLSEAWEDHPAKLVTQIGIALLIIGFLVYSIVF